MFVVMLCKTHLVDNYKHIEQKVTCYMYMYMYMYTHRQVQQVVSIHNYNNNMKSRNYAGSHINGLQVY